MLICLTNISSYSYLIGGIAQWYINALYIHVNGSISNSANYRIPRVAYDAIFALFEINTRVEWNMQTSWPRRYVKMELRLKIAGNEEKIFICTYKVWCTNQ